ncbi:ribosome biogenesis protein SLX9 homolog [Physella acuta]|uniref:ribosome biogenesis protein SLX9 homolog n=1 Tax=Physella acuta TaxID=109671 RepID=UPI0027DE327F|nr:ribosome biogenesis protein SLX9 homolog [Physella acuta]XP_059145703.1 ribosome biogenesis protein SLX9 homolog [Physella acuta]
MGKMKRMRQKLHTAAAKVKAKNKTEDQEMMEESTITVPHKASSTANVPRGENLFQNLKIAATDLITQKLPDFDARSTITSKTFKGQNLKKKDKQKIRHDVWMSKIDAVQGAKKKEIERKRKQKVPIVGDLTPMEDALPTLELLLKKTTESASSRKNAEKPRPIPKESRRKKQMIDDISLFHKIVQHPLFQQNAETTIKEHLKHKLMLENEKNT